MAPEPFAVIRLEPHVLATTDDRSWCSTCNLSSGVDVVLGLVNADTLELFGRIAVRYCRECEAEIRLPAPPD
jgi:hypothetical protein